MQLHLVILQKENWWHQKYWEYLTKVDASVEREGTSTRTQTISQHAICHQLIWAWEALDPLMAWAWLMANRPKEFVRLVRTLILSFIVHCC